MYVNNFRFEMFLNGMIVKQHGIQKMILIIDKRFREGGGVGLKCHASIIGRGSKNGKKNKCQLILE